MKIVVEYEADDGKRFPSKQLCSEYEEECKNIKEANSMLEQGSSLFDVMGMVNKTYPNWITILSEDQIELLKKITKDSQFVVSYWQCRGNPGYKVCAIVNSKAILLFGDVGSWSGPYGNWISLSELLRYAKHPGNIF